MILRVYWQLRGETVHLKVYAGQGETFRPAGNLMLSAAEFLELSRGQFKPEFYEVKGETQ